MDTLTYLVVLGHGNEILADLVSEVQKVAYQRESVALGLDQDERRAVWALALRTNDERMEILNNLA